MKKKVLILLGALISTNLFAMELKGVALSDSKLYVASQDTIKKTLEKMDVSYSVDSDGDLEIPVDLPDSSGVIYVIFSSIDGKIWELKLVAQFGTKPSRYNELLTYVNDWNSKHKYPTLTLPDNDSLQAKMSYPIQYGFNPDEFEENFYYPFIKVLTRISNETNDFRR